MWLRDGLIKIMHSGYIYNSTQHDAPQQQCSELCGENFLTAHSNFDCSISLHTSTCRILLRRLKMQNLKMQAV